MPTFRRGTALAVTLVAAIVMALPGGAALAGSSNPPGNNGTVKVNEETATSTANDPHVGCDFQIDFFGLDAGTQTADVTFAVVPPTGNDMVRQDTVDVNGSGAAPIRGSETDVLTRRVSEDASG